jgi:antitoxin MazE
MQVQMQKWGNSLAVRVPKAIAKDAKLAAGDSLEIDVDEQGVLRLQRASKVPTLAQLVAKITPENRYAEVSWGAETKREAVEW